MFKIDTEKGMVTYPEDSSGRFDSSGIELRKTIVASLSNCMECLSKVECASSPEGCTVSIHPYEPEVASERRGQATPEFRGFCSKRAAGERIISPLTRHGGRHARYIGIFKVWCQEIPPALNHNMKAFHRLPPATS